MYMYWLEIIERAHAVSITTVFRNQKWIEGIVVSYLNNNYYSFAANLRGLIESMVCMMT